jgi:RHS repeat-associated protein
MAMQKQCVYTKFLFKNRMASSMVYNKAANSRSTTGYTYDAYGRRTVSEDANPANRAMGSAQAVRTLSDAFTFDVLQEGQLTSRGGFNDYYAIPDAESGGTEGGITDPNAVSGLRYQYVGDGSYTSATERTRNTNTGTASPSRYTGSSVSLYAQGEAVAVSYTSSGASRGGVSYLGKDILGSVKASYDGNGVLEERYEYDAFGTPYKGDLSGGMNYGYTGKPWDAGTGLYDYGYRDYQPGIARFTTVDPVRDGNNWFSYVANDPVNWVDPWGLTATDPNIQLLSQNDTGLSDIGNMATDGCNFRALQSVAEIETGTSLTAEQIREAVTTLQSTPDASNPDQMVITGDLYVNNADQVINDAFDRLGQPDTYATSGYGAEENQEPDYYRRQGTTPLGNRHYVIVDSNGNLLFDPYNPDIQLDNTSDLEIYLHTNTGGNE